VGDLNLSKRRRWIGVLMKNGTVHIKEYLGPYDFRDSFAYEAYKNSPHVERLVGPITVSVKVDHEAIIRQKATR